MSYIPPSLLHYIYDEGYPITSAHKTSHYGTLFTLSCWILRTNLYIGILRTLSF
jgi:hypothetical protein